MSEQAGEKSRGGAPKANKNARKHGLYAARSALKDFGPRAIDARTSVGRALTEWRSEIERDLGGAAVLSAQQRAVLDVLVRTKVLLDGIDAFIFANGVASKRKRAAYPIVQTRLAFAESLVRHLQVLGLERRAAAVPDLQAYIASRASTVSQAAAAPREAPEPSSHDSRPIQTESSPATSSLDSQDLCQ